MGWVTYDKPKGVTARQALEREFTSLEFVEYAYVGGVAYIAARDTRPERGGKVFGLVVMLAGRPRDEHNFGYKDIPERYNPVDAQAPARVLDALDPTENEEAQAWRARCRANLAKVAPQDGDIVEFAQPLDYGRYGTYTTLTFHKQGRRTWWTPVSGDTWLRLGVSRLKDRDYVIVAPGGSYAGYSAQRDEATGEWQMVTPGHGQEVA